MSIVLFWLCVGVLAYVYVGYPAALIVLSFFRRPVRPGAVTATPSMTILFSARDEAESLPAKLQSLERLNYPRDKLQVLAVSDGSSDETAAILTGHPMVEATIFEESVGKNLALNHLIPSARGDVLIFTDANTIIDTGAVRACARWFDNPDVGFVAGHVPYERIDESDRVRRGSNVYWEYEARLRAAESRLGSVLVGAGGLFAISKEIWRPVPPDVANDFHLPTIAAAAGRKSVYEPEFVGTEKAYSKLSDEFWRTRRIVSRGVRGTMRLLPTFLKQPFRLWQLISHKILRWLTLLFLAGALYFSYRAIAGPQYFVFFILQLAAYGAAAAGAIGHMLGRREQWWWLPHVAFQALALQTSAMLGVITGLILGAPSAWSKPTSAR